MRKLVSYKVSLFIPIMSFISELAYISIFYYRLIIFVHYNYLNTSKNPIFKRDIPDSQQYPWDLDLINNVQEKRCFLTWKVFNSVYFTFDSKARNAQLTFLNFGGCEQVLLLISTRIIYAPMFYSLASTISLVLNA